MRNETTITILEPTLELMVVLLGMKFVAIMGHSKKIATNEIALHKPDAHARTRGTQFVVFSYCLPSLARLRVGLVWQNFWNEP
jgi:hypothetical protein